MRRQKLMTVPSKRIKILRLISNLYLRWARLWGMKAHASDRWLWCQWSTLCSQLLWPKAWLKCRTRCCRKNWQWKHGLAGLPSSSKSSHSLMPEFLSLWIKFESDIKKRNLLSAFQALVEHVVKKDCLGWIDTLNIQAFDHMLLLERCDCVLVSLL